MTSLRTRAPEPGDRRPRFVPGRRPAEEDIRELREPYDLPGPEFDVWPGGRPEYAAVIAQRRDWQPGQPPSLAGLLEAEPARTRDPEPDLEAEP